MAPRPSTARIEPTRRTDAVAPSSSTPRGRIARRPSIRFRQRQERSSVSLNSAGSSRLRTWPVFGNIASPETGMFFLRNKLGSMHASRKVGERNCRTRAKGAACVWSSEPGERFAHTSSSKFSNSKIIQTRVHDPAARSARAVHLSSAPRRAWGMPGARCTLDEVSLILLGF
jgi:hypothetical protein